MIVASTMNYLKAGDKKVLMRCGWQKLAEGKTTLNVDVSFDIDSGTGGTCAIIIDHNGGFVVARPDVFDAPMAEAFALRDGLLIARQLSCNRIIVQTDCLEVVNCMRDGFSATAAAAVFDECQTIWEWFDVISIEHCNREANQVAHGLARNSFMKKTIL